MDAGGSRAGSTAVGEEDVGPIDDGEADPDGEHEARPVGAGQGKRSRMPSLGKSPMEAMSAATPGEATVKEKQESPSSVTLNWWWTPPKRLARMRPKVMASRAKGNCMTCAYMRNPCGWFGG